MDLKQNQNKESWHTSLAEVDKVGGSDGHAIKINLGGKLAHTGFKCCNGIGHCAHHSPPSVSEPPFNFAGHHRSVCGRSGLRSASCSCNALRGCKCFGRNDRRIVLK